MNENSYQLVHVGKVESAHGEDLYLFLRQEGQNSFRWYSENAIHEEEATEVWATNPHEALRLAEKQWHENLFASLYCGVRYDLDPRDEHGTAALFHQMVESYSQHTVDSAYFDPDCGHLCFVDFASDEALELWHRLEYEGRL